MTLLLQIGTAGAASHAFPNTEEMPESKIMTIPLAYIHTALETRLHNVIPPDPSTI